MLDQLSENIAKTNGLFHSGLIDKLVADLHGGLAIITIQSFSRLNEFLNGSDPLAHHTEFDLLAIGARFLQLSHSLLHGSKSLFVVSILINLNLGTSIVEIR